jgi:hypothetical protein
MHLAIIMILAAASGVFERKQQIMLGTQKAPTGLSGKAWVTHLKISAVPEAGQKDLGP